MAKDRDKRRPATTPKKSAARSTKAGKATTAKGKQLFDEFTTSTDEVFARALAVYRSPRLAMRDIVRRLCNKSPDNKNLEAANICFPLEHGAPLDPMPLMEELLPAAYWEVGGLKKFAACLGGRTKIRGLGALDPERTTLEFRATHECGTYFRRDLADGAYPTARSAHADDALARDKPGPRPTADWHRWAAYELLRAILAGEGRPSNTKLAEFCDDKTNYHPNDKEMRLLVRELARLLRLS